MKLAKDILLETIADNRNGSAKGIYAVCTANADVLEACFKQAKTDETVLLIESTSNQVDQFGGYTGMKPANFIRYINQIAEKIGFPKELILPGGDHLGPNAWQSLPAEKAMTNAKTLIEEYVKEGYLKIHIDASMFCSDDPGDRRKPLSNEIVAERTVALCRVAEDAWKKYRPDGPKPVYVIGTEVPVPGGAREEENEVVPTTPEDAAQTIEIIRRSMTSAGLNEAWERVIAAVVQPGVEFGDDRVFCYTREKAKRLSQTILKYDRLVFEAHSTDYQTETGLKELVEDHFCILKVGPWLTFAYREALFALAAMETEIMGKRNMNLSRLRETLENAMIKEPMYWEKYYQGNKRQRSLKRKYSFSDRLRYYWPMTELHLAKNKLYENLRTNKIPVSLLSQFMPVQFHQVSDGSITTDPRDLVESHIQSVTGMYSRACGLSHAIKK